ncbi:response regulator [Azonexus sp. IMCC34839]|uniref:response regulator n=1 Tax=Azonexus sp. IMCC34839 TaxID=3133695 RepID=UPI00399A71FF
MNSLMTNLPSTPRTLLLVDDEESILSSLRRMLRRDGYQIVTATSGDEGLKRLAEAPVGVILSDQRMPGMTGTEFLSIVKESYPETIRMVLSGYTDINSITEAINRGAIYKFLTKPWDDELLRGHIAEAFQRYEMKQENHRLAAINQAMVDAISDIVLLVSMPSGQILSGNRAASESLGYLAEELTALNISEIEVMPQDMFYWEEMARESFRPISHVETEFRTRHMGQIPVAKSTALAGIGSDKVIIVIAQDLSKQRNTEHQLASANAQLASIFEATVEGLLVIGNDDQLLGMNHRFAQVWNLDQSQASSGKALLTQLGKYCQEPEESVLSLLDALSDSIGRHNGLLHRDNGQCIAWAKRPQMVRGLAAGQVFSFFPLLAAADKMPLLLD